MTPLAPAKSTEPEVMGDRYALPEIYILVVEAVPETVKPVVEAYGKVEAFVVEVAVKYWETVWPATESMA